MKVQSDSVPNLKKEIDKLRAPLPQFVSRDDVAKILGISPVMVDHLTRIGVFEDHSTRGEVKRLPSIISTADAMALIGMTDRSAFYKRVRLGFYRSFGNNAFSPAMIVADHAAYLKSGLAEGDYRRHVSKKLP